MEPQGIFCYEEKCKNCKIKCLDLITVILLLSFAVVIGLIIGAAISTGILAALPAVIVLAIILGLLLILSIILLICNKKKDKDCKKCK